MTSGGLFEDLGVKHCKVKIRNRFRRSQEYTTELPSPASEVPVDGQSMNGGCVLQLMTKFRASRGRGHPTRKLLMKRHVVAHGSRTWVETTDRLEDPLGSEIGGDRVSLGHRKQLKQMDM
jgi:hypothetical protein